MSETTDKKFKYQALIDELASYGCHLPLLYAPDGMTAYRYVFADSNRQNHIPQYFANPKRILQDIAKGKATTSMLALSCFNSSGKAKAFYSSLCKSFRNAPQAIGDCLAEGILNNHDGRKTVENNKGHFDFYEYEGCDLSESFKVKSVLVNRDNDERY